MAILYKAVTPAETTKRILSILSGTGIKLKPVFHGKEGLSFSTRLTIDYGKLGHMDIGTNGKGMTREFAMASALGELMERLENKMLIFTVKYASPAFRMNNPELRNLYPGKLSFRYFPDEEYITIPDSELCEWGQRLLPGSHAFDIHEEGKSYDMPFLPFFNTSELREERLPYDLIRFASGSTGLCAGNIPQEAILQGLCEIFERYVLQRIYIDTPLLPTIPMTAFNGTETAQRIKALAEKTGWRFIVKDCSLQQGFPVIGLLIIDDAAGKYTFRLGSDLYPEIALQRCFSEIFQGTDIDSSPFLPTDLSGAWDIAEEYNRNVINGRGYFPVNIFHDTSGNMMDFWQGCPVTGNSFGENLDSVLRWLKLKGYTLYVRDNSFLGFPAYHLYIPGLSDVDYRLYDIRKHLTCKEKYYKVKAEYRIKGLEKAEAESLVAKYIKEPVREVRLFDYSWSAKNRLDRNLMLSLLSYRASDSGRAYTYMDKFLKQKRSGRLGKYYYCIRDFFILRHRGYEDGQIVNILGTLYSEDTAKEVLSDMGNPDEIFRNFPLPTSFDCKGCPLSGECAYDSIIELESAIQEAQLRNNINQEDMKNLFVRNFD